MFKAVNCLHNLRLMNNMHTKLLLLALLCTMPLLHGVELVIPNGTTAIENSQYANRTDITSIVIPESVTSIGGYAFSQCSALTSIVIPNSVTSIGERAFEDCSSLTNLTIPSSVTLAKTSAFKGCIGLKTLIINCEGTKFSIDLNPISGLDNLTDVYFNNGMPSVRWTFGTSKPVVHGSTMWNGYEFKDITVDRLESRMIPLPATEGKIGQVLMVTANGYEWKDMPDNNSAASTDKFHLDAGWNLISLPEAELTENCKAELMKTYKFFMFDKGANTYVQANALVPRGCYWVFVTNPSTIHFTTAR